MEKESPNVHSFSNQYNAFFRKCEELITANKENWCILAIDLEHFKLFNEMYGIEKGDLLLADIWTILKDFEKNKSCAVAYLGQDDFAIFMQYSTEAIQDIYEKLKNTVYSMTTMVGFLPAIGVYRLHSKDKLSINLFDNAHLALTEAKKHRSERIKEYDSVSHTKHLQEYKTLLNIKEAMDQNEITFFLQPQCRFSTRKIVGAEALARWQKKDGTFVSPADFIPVLEKHGFIADFDKMIWEMV